MRARPVVATRPHWYPLATFDTYYATAGVSDSEYGQFAMNGRSYSGGWYTYGTDGGWESRSTLGRHCRRMSGTFGVRDSSADGFVRDRPGAVRRGHLSGARSGAVLGQGRDGQPVGSEELGEVGEAGGVAAHGVGGRGDPLHHHLADLLLNGALGIRDVPR